MLHITKEELKAKLRKAYPDSSDEMIDFKTEETWKVMVEVDSMTDEEIEAEWNELKKRVKIVDP